ncbi:MAG: T9SS type A sorting domain-containing protein, partial [Flavobacterium sp.]
PTLNAPANGTVNVGSSVSLTWYNIAGESGFAYQLDTSPEFNSENLQSGTLGEYTSTIGFPGISFNNLLHDTTYFWRIAFLNNAMQSQWSPTWIFGTGATILANADYEPTGFMAYPNPTADKIYLAGEGLESAQYCLIGTDGRVLLERASGDATLDLESLPQGIYFLKINSRGKTHMLKVIKR